MKPGKKYLPLKLEVNEIGFSRFGESLGLKTPVVQ